MKNSQWVQSGTGRWSLGLFLALVCVALAVSSPALAQTVSLSFSPSTVVRGESSVMAATAANGTGPYTYTYQWRLTGTGTWSSTSLNTPERTNRWTSSVDFRVRVVDSLSATSAWSEATLTVLQPVASVSFTPAEVVQSQESVLRGVVTNGTAPFTLTYQWRANATSAWANAPYSDPVKTNKWKSTVDFRVRSVDANSVTSDWSAPATLTVLPSAIAASLSFTPSTVLRGESSVLQSVVTDGTSPFTYTYQWRYTGTGAWSSTTFAEPARTNAWTSSVDFRVRAVDSFKSTSAWSEAATLIVVQPTVTVAFSPATVNQSEPSVLSAVTTNGTGPYTYSYQWRLPGGATWSSAAFTDPERTNTWKSSVEFRARSVDANSVTSDWSEAALLTVLPSAISASLSFNPSNVIRSEESVLTASATNGMAPYTYTYQWRYSGTGTWSSTTLTDPVRTNRWSSSVDFRVRAVDAFSATSDWAEATLTVAQPVVTVSFSPTSVTQGQSSVVSATVTNAIGEATYQWQKKVGTVWTNVVETDSSITNIWPATVDYRARSVASGVTSEWSSAATLTVLPSSLSASLSFAPSNVLRGVESVLTAVATDGTAPYTYSYQWRWTGVTNWTAATFTTAETTYKWTSNIEFRVRAVDSFSATSEWSSVAALTVVQPVVTVGFTPTTVTQSQSSVVSASVTNAIGAVTYQWQKKVGASWTSVTETNSSITDVWPSTVEYRVRSVDENGTMSDWASATLIVLPSAISASLSFTPSTVLNGEQSVLAAVPTNGTAPYSYSYQWRWGSTGTWTSTTLNTPERTNRWTSSVDFRVRVVDTFNSTSAWAEASLTVLQPAVTVAFSPSVVTQSQVSVLTATSTNVLGSPTFQWQYKAGSIWTSITNVEDTITKVWPSTIEYRARSLDTNGLLSAWSDSATLTVMGSEIAATLSFDPTNVVRGVNSVMTAVPTNGTAPYTYAYQWRWSGITGEWASASYTTPIVTNAWASNVDYRVQVVDSFNSTSAWSAAATLQIRQPEVSLTFSPSVVTQSHSSVLSATVTNATAPVTYQWQRLMDGNWVNMAGTDSAITNVWATDVDYRARSIDANSVTSPWSGTATLTVLPSAIAMSLSFSPTNVLRGFESVLTSVASNGYGSYTYYHQWRYSPAGEWSAKSTIPAVFTNRWDGSVDYRVQAVDTFNSTSAWALASLSVVQPVLTVGFTPSVVTQSQVSVLSVSASNVTGAVTYEWSKKVGSVWTSVTNTESSITNVWPSTVDYRVRSVDENAVTSDWATATLTVMPSAIAAGLSFSPTSVVRGVESALTTVPTNGTAPYTYSYQWRWTDGSTNWLPHSSTSPVTTYAWSSNVDFRVRVVDSFKSTSSWTMATLTVLQPEVTVAFSPSTVTQSVSSVLAATVTNTTGSLTYQWQKKVGAVWTNVTDTGAAITNVWGSTIEYRARTIDSNNVTSEWSTAATLTVMPSIISAYVSFSPASMWRGSNSVMTTVVSNGTAPFRYIYESKLTGDVSWASSSYSNAVVTNLWQSSTDYRVKVIDSFNSTSAWSSVGTVTVIQPQVIASFSPATVTQRISSVVSAAVSFASLPVAYEWQRLVNGVWTNQPDTTSAITNTWPSDVDYRARTIDANNVTSEWSSAATLTVLPSAIAVQLAFAPTNVLRGLDSVLTAVATNGYGTYTYFQQWRYSPSGEWSARSEIDPIVTNRWDASVDYRVQAVDSFNSTSAWALASLTVVQPVLTVGFNPSTVTQSVASVLSVSASNVTGAVTYEWQKKVGSVWTSVTNTASAITNVWPETIEYRVRSTDDNSVTSDWASATLTVLPSAIAAGLSFSPTNVIRGVESTMTAVPTNGTAPYAYAYQWRWSDGATNWMSSSATSPVTTYAWASNVDFRVRVVDSFQSTSAWTMATLTVLQPEVTVAFSPSTVTQSVSSVLAAAVTNATGPLTYQWQKKVGATWTNVADTGAAITNVWGSTIEYRARTIDANSVTSEWSSAATLTVMPSIISASVSFSPTNVWNGSNSVLTAVVSNGTAPYSYSYEWKRTGDVEWSSSDYSDAVVTNVWAESVNYRVKVVDSFNSTSAWSSAATLGVVQPLVTASFSPSTVTQRMSSVVSASVQYASGTVAYEWQRLVDGVWTNQPDTTSAITNIWPFDVDYRARTIDANSVTSEWSAAATLTVMASEISVSVAFSPTNVLRGSNSVLTAVATNGYGTYTYFQQWRYSPGGEWSARSETDPVITNQWDGSVDYRVQAVDSFNSTSAWVQATLTVVQPVVTVAFTPSTVTQSVSSVLSASASNVSGSVTWQWQKKEGSVWTNVASSASAITNVWGATVEYRARSVDANNVTSEWATATLTVLPSAISASLSFTSNVVIRGVNSVMAAVPTNGTAPYSYVYEWRPLSGGAWTLSAYTNPVVTNAWTESVEFRVKAIDSFSSTSALATASLTVLQPAVTVAFAPSTVTQSIASVLSATVTNATAPVSYQWQTRVGGVWTNSAGSGAAITNVWAADVDYRARSIDANSVTSEWSSSATLTVMPSIISASVSIAPTNIIRGSNAVVTAVATNGTAPYRYYHQWRYVGDVDWSEETEEQAVVTNRFDFNVDYRVRVADSFNSTSAWAVASLTVRQPLVTASFSPSVVTQSRSSVVSAVVTNATAPITYEWQMLSGAEWTNVAGSASSISNVWASDVDYRVRSIDANSVTSEWSSSATLTVLPSAIAMSLTFSPTNVRSGSNAVLTAVASNGTPPYVYYHQWRYAPAGEWSVKDVIEPIITNQWNASVDYRVQVVDSFNSTSAWMSASLTVVQPAVTVTFTPSTVTQSVASVLSAVVTNASGAVTWQWQKKVGSVWTDVTNAVPVFTNVWPASVEYRARTIDANSVTSDWSTSKTLTVMPSIVSATLTVAPTNIIRGSNAVLTAVATNGTAPYSYVYEWKLTQSVTWATASFTNPIVTNRWESSTDFRVKVIDAFSSTSAWSTVRTLVVQQPLVTLTPTSNSVVQSRANVVTANVANATLPVSYLWQKNDGSGWTDLTNTAATVSNTWPSSLSFRARSVDANSVTSEWSSTSILTVTASAIASTLSFSPTTVYRGSNATLTAVATNGYGAYTYMYEYSPTGTPSWVVATNTGATITQKWDTNVVYRVRVVDSFNATSAWSSASTLTVVQATVALTFTPTQVVNGVRSVLRATVTNNAGPCTYIYETREKGTTNWFASPLTNAVTTNEWLTSSDYRVCAVVDNHYTTQWSTVATLTVVAPTLRITLALSTNEVTFGSPIVMTSTPTNGTGPYTYEYQSKNITMPGQAWVDAPWTTAVVTNTFNNHVLIRARVRDGATTNLSYWSEDKVLLVWPASDAIQDEESLSILFMTVEPGAAPASASRAPASSAASSDLVSLYWLGVTEKEYSIYYAASLTGTWTEWPVRFKTDADGIGIGTLPLNTNAGFFRIREYSP